MLVLLGLLCACSATLAVPTAEYYELEEAELYFERFIQEYNKDYADENEKQVRFQIFKDNLEQANRMNQESSHAVFGITEFMDLTTEEFVNTYTSLSPLGVGAKDACVMLHDIDIPKENAPESYDWREHNVVTRIKHQQACASCYAFSAVGNIEGAHAIKHKQLIELSEQQIVDCDPLNKGCAGGFMNKAFTSLINIGGIQSEASYPYVGVRERCKFNASQVAVKITGCYKYHLASQETLKKLVYKVGPISVAVDAKGLHTYKRGVLSDKACQQGVINHAVLIVGYGTEDGKPYWLIKNSYGQRFGEKGYVKVTRGEGAHSCGLMNTFMSSAEVK